MQEAITMCEAISGQPMNWEYIATNRIGDHIWWISDISKFQAAYPGYKLRYDVKAILEEIHAENHSRWSSVLRAARA
jgi:CDP-paratose 2-epimerase